MTDDGPLTHHRCAWSRACQSELSIRREVLSGAGIGANVLIPALIAADAVWYTRAFGDHDVEAISVDARDAAGLPNSRHTIRPPLASWLPSEERYLSEDVRDALSIKDHQSVDELTRHSVIRATAWIHDNCFFMCGPADDQTVTAVVRRVLRLHEGYLRHPLDEGLCGEVVGRLRSHGTIRLRSRPARDRLVVAYRASMGWLSWWRWEDFAAGH